MHTDNLSSTLQDTHTSCYKAQQIATVCFLILQGMKEEASFLMFFEKDDPKLPRKKNFFELL